MANWQTLGTKIAYSNKWFSIREDDVINPIGQKTVYGIMELAHDVVYVAAIEDGGLWLTNQYRYTLKQNSWEVVAGQSDGQPPLEAAARELLEETGLKAAELKEIGQLSIATGLSSSKINLVLATGLTKVTEQLDEVDGILEARLFSFDEVKQMIMSGEIICAHTIASYYIATEYLKSANEEKS